jgi:hypothetical protein
MPPITITAILRYGREPVQLQTTAHEGTESDRKIKQANHMVPCDRSFHPNLADAAPEKVYGYKT